MEHETKEDSEWAVKCDDALWMLENDIEEENSRYEEVKQLFGQGLHGSTLSKVYEGTKTGIKSVLKELHKALQNVTEAVIATALNRQEVSQEDRKYAYERKGQWSHYWAHDLLSLYMKIH
ncbi:hypothetical protein BDF19DRAFT_326494 [Syncephalis fuscata]|nr:hypothetical protein BDF19DRAFT_326494 [Syncephalis fuscata]